MQMGRRHPDSVRLDEDRQRQSAVENPTKKIGRAECSEEKCYKVANSEKNFD